MPTASPYSSGDGTITPASGPNLDRAQHYALGRLERELSPALAYHSVVHTRDEVVPAATVLEGVTAESMLLLLTAAWFHDLGFIERWSDNEVIGVRLAIEALPDFGYTPAHIAVIAGIILATRLPQTPHTPLEMIMADADLDLLGRDDYLARNEALRAELTASGSVFSDEVWYADQLQFIHQHHYFTAAARQTRDAGKQRNVAAINALLKQGPG
jgi:uncharacterized protein